MSTFETTSPVDGSAYYSAKEDSAKDINNALEKAIRAKAGWQAKSITERAALMTAFVDEVVFNRATIAEEITWQMGRPISQSCGEISGFEERARYMISVAETAMAPLKPDSKRGFERWVERVPLGVVAVLSPWNYPLLTSVNAIVPALMAGNCVVLKHSFQTPLVAERYAEAAKKAGLPDGVFQILHLNHGNTAKLVGDARVEGVFFTGSVAGGLAIQSALGDKFIPCGLELGGKDPAYVREDADLDFTVGNLVDGAYFNSGQSCCGIERIYVHESHYDNFIKQFAEITSQYRLGDPLDPETNLGPVVKTAAADFVRQQIDDAISKGAKSLLDESHFSASKKGTPYLAPHVLANVDHSMDVMSEESFGPVVGIQKVSGDAEAIQMMNDSQYGLTASLWTEDIDTARTLGSQIETGTVFLNRCDYLDPELAWTGVKNSGRGVTLSTHGYEHVTRSKSFHLRTER